MKPTATKFLIGFLVILAGGGCVGVLSELSHSHQTGMSEQVIIIQPPPPPAIHSAAWYVAHPEVLKVDEQRCAGDASAMTPAACQNVASADTQLAVADYAKAAATLNAGATSKTTANTKSQ
jgi:hypothetical protein